MKVAIEAVANRSGGGLAVLRRTVAAIATDPRIHELHVFGGIEPVLSLPTSARNSSLTTVIRHEISPSWARRFSWYERGFEAACGRVGADVALCMNTFGKTTRPRVALIQQALFFDHAAHLEPGLRLKMEALGALLRTYDLTKVTMVTQDRRVGKLAREELGIDTISLPLGAIPSVPTEVERTGVVVFSGELRYKRLRQASRITKLLNDRGHRSVGLLLNDDPRPEREVFHALERAAAVLVTSDVESLSLPVMEALAHGAPLVLPDLAWARSNAGDAALFVAPGDDAATVGAIETLLSDASVRAQASRRCRERHRELTTPNPYERLVDLLEAA